MTFGIVGKCWISYSTAGHAYCLMWHVNASWTFYSYGPKNPGGVARVFFMMRSCSSSSSYYSSTDFLNRATSSRTWTHPLKHSTTKLFWEEEWRGETSATKAKQQQATVTVFFADMNTLLCREDEWSHCSYVALHVRAALGRGSDSWQQTRRNFFFFKKANRKKNYPRPLEQF